ncbi:hypothetical protein TSH100_15140 [Azospirillum sp. TSH100]|uniref:hypothetical protein n=1 Tax=Azospirillum sp. TSH100 TaxID=652764 RepID=UPI000D606CE7|nr:hypothetical protein [Azospirillum sp. TSH100]PWC85489.1 hypothetical protein TSH100_15140 [Azospirillum sp. TSH100]
MEARVMSPSPSSVQASTEPGRDIVAVSAKPARRSKAVALLGPGAEVDPVLAAARVLGIETRRQLQDAIKAFEGYVDPEGNATSAPGRAYTYITSMVYAPFGLNSKAVKEIMAGTNLRDRMPAWLVRYVDLAEQAAAAQIMNGIALKLTRKAIRAKVKESITAIADFCRATFPVGAVQ